jgi:FK506-binding nuclear protein
VATGSKRPRESDVSATSDKPSKAEKKAKKQKGGNGEAVSASVEKAEEASPKEKKDKKEKKKEKKDKEAKAAPTKELAGGLKITDVTVGEGPQARPGQTLQMRYIGKLTNGKTFDSNTKGKPVCLSAFINFL